MLQAYEDYRGINGVYVGANDAITAPTCQRVGRLHVWFATAKFYTYEFAQIIIIITLKRNTSCRVIKRRETDDAVSP